MNGKMGKTFFKFIQMDLIDHMTQIIISHSILANYFQMYLGKIKNKIK